MTDVSLFTDDESMELMAETVHNKTLGQISSRTGIELKTDITEQVIGEENSENEVVGEEETMKGGNNGGGILEQLKRKYGGYLENAKVEYKSLKKQQQTGGGPGALVMVVVIIKLILMTMGSFIFSYFPVVLLISLMCVYIEYKLTVTMGYDIIGLPLVYMICACCCPCGWTFFRLFKGWTNKLNISTGGLWPLLTNCSNEISILDIYKVDGSVCKDGDCFIVSKDCHNVLYPREK